MRHASTTLLRKEVLPPRPAPQNLCAAIERDLCLRASVVRCVWIVTLFVVTVAYFLEMLS